MLNNSVDLHKPQSYS